MKTIAVALLFIMPVLVQGAQAPKVAKADDRIKIFTYHEYDTFPLRIYLGYETTLIFAQYEKITSVTAGDTVTFKFDVTTEHSLSIKATVAEDQSFEERISTNLTVLTDTRVYAFTLTRHPEPDILASELMFVVRFRYPEDERKADEAKRKAQQQERAAEIANVHSVALSSQTLNFGYAYSGSQDIAPMTAYDDGRFTYFQFHPQQDIPSIFLVNNDGTESVVNIRREIMSYRLKLMSVSSREDLPTSGRLQVIAALVGDTTRKVLYVRIFDVMGNRVIDQTERNFPAGSVSTKFKQQLRQFIKTPPPLSHSEQAELLAKIRRLVGYAAIDERVIVVQRVWRQFTFRRGETVACIFNTAFRLDYRGQSTLRQAKQDRTPQLVGGTR